MRHYRNVLHYILFLIVSCLGAFAGCARRERDNEPKPIHPQQSIRIIDLGPTGVRTPQEDYDLLGIPNNIKLDTYYNYTNQAGYLSFIPADTTWDEYIWRFARSEQVVTMRSFQLYYREIDFSDTVYLTCRDKRFEDSVTVKLSYNLKRLSEWPYYGTYTGRLYYQGDMIDTLSLRFFLAPHKSDSFQSIIYCSGIYQRICGATRDLAFKQAFSGEGGGLILSNGFSIEPSGADWQDGMTNCKPGNLDFEYGFQNSVLHWRDSVKIKAIIRNANYGSYPVGRLDSVVFKGKKQV